MIHKILYKLSILSLLFTVSFVLYVSYINLVKSNEFRLTSPISVAKANIKGGDILPVNFSFCKKAGKEAKISYQLVNGQIINLSQVDIVTSSTCIDETDLVQIPHTIPASEYKLIIRVSYARSIFKTETYVYETEVFNIK
jgi:hypothetical protein